MRKISFWRYSAVNRKTLFAALACALLAFSMLGCGATNHLQSIQLSTSNTKPGTGVGTYINLYGADAPGQFFTWGNYSNGKQKLLYGDGVVYQISITPGSYVLYQGGYIPLTTQYYDPNANPPQVIQLSPSGVVTAVTPFICTWENFATTGRPRPLHMSVRIQSPLPIRDLPLRQHLFRWLRMSWASRVPPTPTACVLIRRRLSNPAFRFVDPRGRLYQCRPRLLLELLCSVEAGHFQRPV